MSRCDFSEALLELDRARPSYCPCTPTAKQGHFLSLNCREALYGGAAAGGKSYALLMAALQYVHVPGYNALLLRRTYVELAMPDAILDVAHQWLRGKVDWDAKNYRYEFPSSARLSFSYLANENDIYRYKSAQFQFVGFDELTGFTRAQYIYLHSRVRRPTSGPLAQVPPRTRSASNPGDIGHDWVKARFVSPGEPDCVFVPANRRDNPHIDQKEYAKSLEKLDTTTRRQLDEGVWEADSNGLVYEHFSKDRNVVATRPPGDWEYILSLDFGYSDDCAIGVLGWPTHSNVVYAIESCKLIHTIPSVCAEFVTEISKRYRFSRIVGDTGGLGKGYAEEIRQRYNIPVEAAEKTNKRGYISLINGALERRELVLLAGQDELVAELTSLRWNKVRKEEAPGQANHLTDMLLYGWRRARAWDEAPRADAAPAPGTEAWYAQEQARMREEELAAGERMARREGLRLLGRRR